MRQAARQSDNRDVVEMTAEVLQTFDLWEQFLDYRKELISRADA